MVHHSLDEASGLRFQPISHRGCNVQTLHSTIVRHSLVLCCLSSLYLYLLILIVKSTLGELKNLCQQFLYANLVDDIIEHSRSCASKELFDALVGEDNTRLWLEFILEIIAFLVRPIGQELTFCNDALLRIETIWGSGEPQNLTFDMSQEVLIHAACSIYHITFVYDDSLELIELFLVIYDAADCCKRYSVDVLLLRLAE